MVRQQLGVGPGIAFRLFAHNVENRVNELCTLGSTGSQGCLGGQES